MMKRRQRDNPVPHDVIHLMPASIEVLDRKWSDQQVSYVRKELFDEAVRAINTAIKSNGSDLAPALIVIKIAEALNEAVPLRARG